MLNLHCQLELRSSARLVGETFGCVCDHISKETRSRMCHLMPASPFLCFPDGHGASQAVPLCLPNWEGQNPFPLLKLSRHSRTKPVSMLFHPRRVTVSLLDSHKRCLRASGAETTTLISEWEEGRGKRIEIVEPTLCDFFFLNFNNPGLPAGSEKPSAIVGTGISLVPGKCSKTQLLQGRQ